MCSATRTEASWLECGRPKVALCQPLKVFGCHVAQYETFMLLNFQKMSYAFWWQPDKCKDFNPYIFFPPPTRASSRRVPPWYSLLPQLINVAQRCNAGLREQQLPSDSPYSAILDDFKSSQWRKARSDVGRPCDRSFLQFYVKVAFALYTFVKAYLRSSTHIVLVFTSSHAHARTHAHHQRL